MQRPRLIFTDLDGTLFGPDSLPTPRTVDAVQKATDAGITVVAATGRSFRTAINRVASLSSLRWALCSNGAVEYDLLTDTIVSAIQLSRERVDQIIDLIRGRVPDATFGWETLEGFGFEPGFAHPPADIAADQRPRTGPQRQDDIVEAVKVYIAHPTLSDVALQREFAPMLPEDIDASTSGVPFIEATDSTANKGSAAASFAARHNTPRDRVAALGDQLNDHSMLTFAGHAIAMGNAHPDIKSIADTVTAPNTEDGAAQAIEWLADLPE